jgi:hypothetical protein
MRSRGDPFAGTGTTGQAAQELGSNCILIEQEAEYIADIKTRLAASLKNPPPPKTVRSDSVVVKPVSKTIVRPVYKTMVRLCKRVLRVDW